MRLTERCLELFKELRATRWLTTGQVRRRFFPHATPDAARKRLRKLARAGYLVMAQEHRMSEAVFGLAAKGKRALEREGITEISLERNPPRQIEHFAAINDVRIAAETSLPLSYFFACWELSALGWNQPIIPDAVFALRGRTFAVEVDRGLESIRYFVRTKASVYRRGLEGLPLSAVLVAADSKARMLALLKAVADERQPFLFTTIDMVRKHGLAAPIFLREANGKGEKLV